MRIFKLLLLPLGLIVFFGLLLPGRWHDSLEVAGGYGRIDVPVQLHQGAGRLHLWHGGGYAGGYSKDDK